MPRKNLPSYVQRIRSGKAWKYRGWVHCDGRRQFGTVFDTPEAAAADAARLRKAVAPSWVGSFEDVANNWLAEVEATRAPDTVQFYRACLKTVWRVVPKSTPIDAVTPAMLRVFALNVEGLEIGAQTIRHCRSVLHNLFAWVIRSGGLTRANPVAAVTWPKAERKAPHVLNEVELRDVLVRVDDVRDRDLMVFLAYTGLRRAEMARVRVADVALQDGVLWVRGKRGSTSQPIPDDAMAAARRLVAAADGRFLVFGATDGARRSRIGETFRRWQRLLKEPRLHPHTLRHSLATILLRRGESAAVVQRFLRHASYATTQRYVHMVEADVRAATSGLRLLGDVDGAEHG